MKKRGKQEETNTKPLHEREELESTIDESVLDTTTVFGSPLVYLEGAADNSNDAIRKRRALMCPFDPFICVIVDQAHKVVKIIDNGYGVNAAGRKAIVSWGYSPKRDETGYRTKGKFGTHLKTARDFCDEIEVISLCKEDGDGLYRRIMYTIQSQKDALFGRTKLYADPIERPSDWPLPPREVGTVITMRNFFRGKFPTVERIMKMLGENLSPDCAELVLVKEHEGDTGVRLQMREIVGQQVKRELIYTLPDGRTQRHVSVRLYVPTHRKRTDDLMIGADGPVMLMNQFLGNVQEGEKKYVPNFLFDPSICGWIDVLEWNQWAVQHRKSFQNNLFFERAEVAAFFQTIDSELSLEMDELRGVSEIESYKEDREAMDYIVSLFNNTFEEEKEEMVTVSLIPSVRNVELLRKESITIRITKATGTSGNFKWDFSEAFDLTCDTDTGRVIKITAGDKDGKYTIRLFDTHNPKISTQIKVSVVKEKFLRISPSRIEVEVGETTRFTAVNHEGEAKNLRWRFGNENVGGELTIYPELSEAEVVWGTSEGRFTLELYDVNKHDAVARSEIKVVKECDDKDEGTIKTLTIEGQKIKVDFQPFASQELASTFQAGERVHQIYINPHHKMYIRAKADGKKSWYNQMMSIIIYRHIEHAHQEFTPGQANNHFEALWSQVMIKNKLA
jgi:hypothetical protein